MEPVLSRSDLPFCPRADVRWATALIVIVGLATLALPSISHGQFRSKRGPASQGQTTKPDGSTEIIRPCGLEALFPTQARCPEIASPFGSETRHDGSRRPEWEFGGYHGGIDISLDEGTSLLALAAGTVASKDEGGQLEGNYLWLRHSPEETGLPYWVYAKYQHLQSLPELSIGAKVAVGQVIARSGRTGTTGGHFGAYGYPHLHLTVRTSQSGDENVGSRGSTQGPKLVDPLAIYHEAGAKSRKAGELSGEKAVRIPYATTDGRLWPQGTRTVWPVACQPR